RRQAPRREREKQREQPVALQRQAGGEDRPFDAEPRYFDLAAVRIIEMMIDLAQRQDGETDGPEAEFADAGLLPRYEQRIGDGVSQMRLRDADQAAHAALEARPVSRRRQIREVAAFLGED